MKIFGAIGLGIAIFLIQHLMPTTFNEGENFLQAIFQAGTRGANALDFHQPANLPTFSP